MRASGEGADVSALATGSARGTFSSTTAATGAGSSTTTGAEAGAGAANGFVMRPSTGKTRTMESRADSAAMMGVWHQTQSPSIPRWRRCRTSSPWHSGQARVRFSSGFSSAFSETNSDSFPVLRAGMLSFGVIEIATVRVRSELEAGVEETVRCPASDSIAGISRSSGIDESTTPSSTESSAEYSTSTGGVTRGVAAGISPRPNESRKRSLALPGAEASSECRVMS